MPQAFDNDHLRDMLGTDNMPMLDDIMRAVGNAGYGSEISTFMSQFDRFQKVPFSPNKVVPGVTFMTRPHLNLNDSNLARNRNFAPFVSRSPTDLGFAIRCWMDPFFANRPTVIQNAHDCPRYNHKSPWLAPMCNGLTAITGFQDPYVDTFTFPEGFHGEDLSIVSGGDDMNKTVDLSLSFVDPQYGPLVSMFMLWRNYMSAMTKGLIMSHPHCIDQVLMDYTVSIYRFTLDPTYTYITGFARAAMAYPKSIPYGAMMNRNEGEKYSSSIGKFTIPFQANLTKYCPDYAILRDFNTLAERYWPEIRKRAQDRGTVLRNTSGNNFRGLPYVVSGTGSRSFKLVFVDPEDPRPSGDELGPMEGSIDSLTTAGQYA